jgi:catechol 2,3-dioxygenase-like lactoylglutathione lyase family enzyme
MSDLWLSDEMTQDAITLSKSTLDVGLVPADADAMRRFYADIIGLPSREPMQLPGGLLHQYEVGDSVLKLYCVEPSPSAAPGGIESAIGYRLITMLLPELDAVVERATQAGVSVQTMTFPAEGGQGVPLAFLSDPDGNFLELVGVPEMPGYSPSLQIGLTVADTERTMAFFTTVLGLSPDPPMTVGELIRQSVQFGRTTVKFWTRDPEPPSRTGGITDLAGIRYMTAWVTDMDDVVARLTEHSIPTPVPLTDLGGARICIAADPDGNWIEFVQTDGG